MGVPAPDYNDPEDDSDSDSVEEIQVKQYLDKDLTNNLKQAKALKAARIKLKKQPGHYKLRDCKHAVVESRFHFYDGNHWSVPVTSNLCRATHRLTVNAVQKEIEKERKKLICNGIDRQQAAQSALTTVNDQFQIQLSINQRRVDLEEEALRHDMEIKKDDVQTHLVRLQNTVKVDQDIEEERKNQVKLLRAMSDASKRTASVESLVENMTETNYKRSVINQDLWEANELLCEEEKDTDWEYQKAMTEMLDESLIKVTYMFDRDRVADQAKEAYKEKVMAMNEPLIDDVTWKSMRTFDHVLDNLKSVYNKVKIKEEGEEAKMKERAAELKAAVQEELVRKMAKKWADKVFAQERARRIQEAETSLDQPNPARDAMMRLLNRVQRQMLLQKFKGKWINIGKKSQGKGKTKGDQQEEELSAHDAKLRQLRTQSRRESSVVRGEEE